MLALFEVYVGHAIDRGSCRAAWGAIVRYVDVHEILTAARSGIVPNTCIDGRLDQRDFPLTAEASVLWACNAVLKVANCGIQEPVFSPAPIIIYTDVRAVWSFFHGKTPFSMHKVIRELHDNLEFSCRARRGGDVLRLSRHRTKGQKASWVRDVKLITPEKNHRARQVAASVLKRHWRAFEHKFHDE